MILLTCVDHDKSLVIVSPRYLVANGVVVDEFYFHLFFIY